jgi:cytochrome c biogenesis protein CcmG, thiol:disulfide interchange protein DsbE
LPTRALYLLPLAVFLVMAAYFALGLTKDPKIIPSALIDKPVPTFKLPPIAGGKGNGFSSDDLQGDVTVVNVFASWCVPCRVEHPLVTELAEMKIARVYGLNYKDRPADALRWLNALGDSYYATGADVDGRIGIDWGVYGVPETFIVDRFGNIRHKQVGPMSPDILKKQIVPIIKDLKK